MKSILAFTTSAALVGVSIADFTLFRQGIGGTGIGGNAWGYQAYPMQDEFDCNNAIDWIWKQDTDVSQDYGVRFEGDNDNPSVVEMNFRGDLHFTWYAEKDGAILDLEDRVIGDCVLTDNAQYFCSGAVGRIEGVKNLDCYIPDVDWITIRNNRPPA